MEIKYTDENGVVFTIEDLQGEGFLDEYAYENQKGQIIKVDKFFCSTLGAPPNRLYDVMVINGHYFLQIVMRCKLNYEVPTFVYSGVVEITREQGERFNHE